LVAHPSLSVKGVPDLVRLARGRQDRIDYASGGMGGSHHVVMEMFGAAAGVKLN